MGVVRDNRRKTSMSTEVTGVVELVILKGPRVERLSAGVVRYGVFLFKMTKDTV